MQQGYVYMPKHFSLLIPHSEKKVTKLLSYLFFRKEHSWRLSNSVTDNSKHFVLVEIESLFF